MVLEARWRKAISQCVGNPDGCEEVLRELMESLCPEDAGCRKAGRGRRADYGWVERLIEEGVPDGRARLILYVISRYLANVKKLDPEDSERIIEGFIENSCRNHGNCSKIYKSWIRNVVSRVSRGGWKPWSLDRIRKEDPQLYDIIASVLGGAGRED